MEVRVARHELCERIHDRYDRLPGLLRLHPGGRPKGTGPRHPASLKGDAAS